jgi:hypothetical protein
MLPGRYLAQALGIDIQYNAYNQTITFGAQSNIPLTTYLQKPTNETVPSLTYNSSVDKVNKKFEWKYKGITYDWYIEAPKDLLVWDRQINQLVNKFYHSNGYTQAAILKQLPEEFQRMIFSQTDKGEGNYTYWAKEDTNYKWTAYLGDRLNTAAQADGYDYFYKAEFILSFVGSAIPYQVTQYPELPGQTVFDNGDCKDKSILLADILKSLGYHVALLYFPGTINNPGHMALGITLNDNQIPLDRNVSYYPHNGRKYYFAETTESNWLLGQPSKDIPAYVYEIN